MTENTTLTGLFKQIIQVNGAVKTGRLLNSIVVYTYFEFGKLIVNVTGVDYLPYVSGYYNLQGQFEFSPVFQDEVALLFTSVFDSYFTAIALGQSPVQLALDIDVVLN